MLCGIGEKKLIGGCGISSQRKINSMDIIWRGDFL